jgi:type I restriction enzyme S subunit
MIELSFKQTSSELMVRASATILFNSILRHGFPLKPLSELAEGTQYGFTASSTQDIEGIKFVRITDLKDGKINWDTVPYCKCDSPDQYILENGDILFARTGATTGKTHLVKESPKAVFASYLIRLRPKKNILADYLYYFFQSDIYWKQIIEEKEGSAQPNVNGKKLIKINLPLVPYELQVAISSFLEVVRLRQDGILQELPELPSPLEEQRRIVARIEELETAIGEARGLRKQNLIDSQNIRETIACQLFDKHSCHQITIEELIGRVNLKNGISIKSINSSSGISCLRCSAMRDGFIDLNDAKPVPMDRVQAEPYLIQRNDVFIIRGNGSKDLVGKAGWVSQASDGKIFPDLFIRVPLDEKKILPRFFVLWWNSPTMRVKIQEMAKTTSGIWKINQGHIASLTIPLLSFDEQHRIVVYLDDLQAKIDSLKHLQAETAAELDALLPSILDKAFKGEL